MHGHAIIVIGASAGGVDALIQVVSGLPRDIPAALFITLHISPSAVSLLPRILSRHGALPAVHPDNNAEIRPGQIYIAPPDHHLMVNGDRIRITRGPKENGHRPSVDPMFRSAAQTYGGHVIGVILSGTRDDGSLGLRMVHEHGGVTIVQDPAEAAYPGMPQHALNNVEPDRILPAVEIPAALVEYSSRIAAIAMPEVFSNEEPIIPELDDARLREIGAHGHPSDFVCPDCGGTLWEMNGSGGFHFRCRLGHAWSPASLIDADGSKVEEALWIAFRALDEQVALAERIARKARQRNSNLVAGRFDAQAADLRQRATLIRQLLEGGGNGVADAPEEHMGDDLPIPGSHPLK